MGHKYIHNAYNYEFIRGGSSGGKREKPEQYLVHEIGL